MNSNNRDRQNGFTLIEVMVVVTIIGILAAIAYPSYQEIMRQTRRTDAFNPLMEIMAKQERYFTDNNTYTDDLTELGLSVNAASKYVTPDSYYLISAASCGAGITSCVKLSAVGQNGQENDAGGDCGSSTKPLTLDSTGAKTPTACWKK